MERLEQSACFCRIHAVYGNFPLFLRTALHAVGHALFAPAVMKMHITLEKRRIKAQIMPFPDSVKALAARHQPDGIEQIGLSLRIVADDDIEPPVRCEAHAPEIAEAIRGK